MTPRPDHGEASYQGHDVLLDQVVLVTGGIEAITTEQFDRVMKTNLYGMFWLSRAALAHIPRGGSIINTASVQGYQPLGRAAQPAEMAPAYVFLASPQASYITGEIVNATGGTPLP